LVIGTISCSTDHQKGSSASLPPTKYKIDGSFEDWKTYKTLRTDIGIDWPKVVVTPKYDGVQFHQFYEDNDSNYLYLFFKFKPSIQERYNNTPVGGDLDLDLGCLYIDTDANTNTGCTEFDAKAGMGTIPGSEIQISFPTGIYADTATNGYYISYEIKRWNSATKSFDQAMRAADSRDSASLIASGEDGVEVALLLSDLQVAEGNQISLAFWGGLTPKENVKRTTIELR